MVTRAAQVERDVDHGVVWQDRRRHVDGRYCCIGADDNDVEQVAGCVRRWLNNLNEVVYCQQRWEARGAGVDWYIGVEVYVAHDDDRRVGGDVVEQVGELVEERGRRWDRAGSINELRTV